MKTIVGSLFLSFFGGSVFLSSSSLQFLSAWKSPLDGLHIIGNKIYNKDGKVVRLRGINRSGAEYECFSGFGFFDGPTNDESILAIKSWNVNIVRLPLNEDCWLNINGVPDGFGGLPYQQAVVEFTERLNRFNIAVILSLLWSAPGDQQALGGQPMADMSHSVDFWEGVATTFRNNSKVIFDLYNEPWPDFNRDSKEAWECWRDGGECPGVDFEAAGMQTLVDTVRNQNATNIVLCAGVRFANALSKFLEYMPLDNLGQLGASFHSYNIDPYPICNTEVNSFFLFLFFLFLFFLYFSMFVFLFLGFCSILLTFLFLSFSPELLECRSKTSK